MAHFKFLFLTLFAAFLFFPAMAQKETNHWFFSPGGYLNFNTKPPDKEIYPYDGSTGQFMASIADSTGRLLFYTDGRKFFNSNHNLMENGEGQYGESRSTQTSFIIPRPGSNKLFYNFITESSRTNDDFTGNGWTIHYSLVDVTAGGGRGRVLSKNNILSMGQAGDALAIFQAADETSFWLVSIGYEGENLSAYKITADTVSHTPVVTHLETSGGGGHFHIKASPDNRYLVLARQTPPDNLLEVYEFDNATGTFSPKFELQTPHEEGGNQYPYTLKRYPYIYEFSPDSKNLFIIEDSVHVNSPTEQIVYSSLLKYDLAVPTHQLFEESKIKIFDFPPSNFGNIGNMQLSPDGRVLIGSNDDFLSAIHQPNACSAVDFTYQAIIFNSWPGVVPFFPAFYFRERSARPAVDAQGPAAACVGSTVHLRAAPNHPDHSYEWTNKESGEKLYGPNPALTLEGTGSGEPDTTYYYLKMTDPAGCAAYDSVSLLTPPSRELTIQGSKSVCPGVEEVSYWIEGAEGSHLLSWSVEGGEIVSGQGTEEILVNWNGPRQDARVQLSAINHWDCEDSVPDFNVKIFKELETEKPKGPDTLGCGSDYYSYSILPTNGSVYNWQVRNGEIVEGQGTARVKVRWEEESPRGLLWIEESVNTVLETCFGRSDTLSVINPAAYGSEHTELLLVSGIIEAPGMLKIRYNIQNRLFFEENFTLFRREAGETSAAWEEIATLKTTENEVVLPESGLSEVVYSYKIAGYNLCGARVESELHTNVLLTGEIAKETQQIQLAWNPYQGWEAGVKTYELYRKLDSANEFVFLGAFDDQKAITLDNLSDGFEHCFYVKAVAKGKKPPASFSNILCLFYDHPIFIPNVITPNGDGKNDFLEISKLELYPENELQIFNRYGKLIYRKNRYTNEWNARGLSTGVYFYHFLTRNNRRSLKGWIQVIR